MTTRHIRWPAMAGTLLVLAAYGWPGETRTSAGTTSWDPALPADTPALHFPPPPLGAIPASEYAARRSALAAGLDDGVFLAVGAREPAADYLPYEQESNFRYLTGITEPDAALVVIKAGDRVEEMLFVVPRDPSRELWEGRRLGPAGAETLTGIKTRPREAFVSVMDSLLARQRRLNSVVALEGRGVPPVLAPEQQIVADLLARHPQVTYADVSDRVMQLRGVKSAHEIDLIRRAVFITALAHRVVQRTAGPELGEFEVQAWLEHTFRRNGAEGTAFASIVGSGPNATTLHYRESDRFMQPGEVLLVDIGASYRGYAADVTRTMPVDRRFTPEAREIYEIVLAAQKAAEARVRPGARWPELNQAAERVIAEGLARIGLIDGPDATYRCESPRFGTICPQYRLYYMHGLGHGVGLDVHDPDASYWAEFGEGSVFTIEPGIYVRADALDHLPDTPENRAMAERLGPIVARYRHIGVRIEDVYALMAEGLERLSTAAPREVAEIEAMRAADRIADIGRHPQVVDWFRRTEDRPVR